jgi:hypothetical protein
VNTYQFWGVVVALAMYLPIGFTILFRDGKQNAGTWLLWWTLDFIAVGSIFSKGGNFYLPLAFLSGCSFILLCILKKKIFYLSLIHI